MFFFEKFLFSTVFTIEKVALVATVPTDSPPQDSGVNAESSGSQKEKSDSPSQKAGQVEKLIVTHLKTNLRQRRSKERKYSKKLKNDRKRPKGRLSFKAKNLDGVWKKSKRERRTDEARQGRASILLEGSQIRKFFERLLTDPNNQAKPQNSSTGCWASIKCFFGNIYFFKSFLQKIDNNAAQEKISKYRKFFEQQTRTKSSPLGWRDHQFSRWSLYTNNFLSQRAEVAMHVLQSTLLVAEASKN